MSQFSLLSIEIVGVNIAITLVLLFGVRRALLDTGHTCSPSGRCHPGSRPLWLARRRAIPRFAGCLPHRSEPGRTLHWAGHWGAHRHRRALHSRIETGPRDHRSRTPELARRVSIL